jgi:hypothetical protein
MSGLADASVRAGSEGQSLGPVPMAGEGGIRGGEATERPSSSAVSQGLSPGHAQNGQPEGRR